MACTNRMLVLVVALAVATASRAAEPPVLHYTATPVLQGDRLQAVDVTLRTQMPANGVLDVVLDHPPAGMTSNVAMDRSDAKHIRLKGSPGSDVSLRYSRAGDANLAADDPFDVPRASATWMHTACPTIFAMPADKVARRVTIDWKLPARWHAFTTLAADTPVTRDQIALSGCLVARDVQRAPRPIATQGTLYVYASNPQASAGFVDLVQSLFTTFAAGSEATGKDYALYITPLEQANKGWSGWSDNGTRMDMVYAPVDASEMVAPILDGYASQFPTPERDRATAWYTRGLRLWLAMRDLADAPNADRMTLTAYLDHLVGAYGDSPFRRATNAELLENWDHAPQAAAIPMERGVIFGWVLDAKVREASHGKVGLADVLRQMAPKPADPGKALVDAVKAAGGGDIAPLYDRYIVRGELLQLSSKELGPCMTVNTGTDGYGWAVQRVTNTCTASVP